LVSCLVFLKLFCASLSNKVQFVPHRADNPS
jgi:hypothetical protein